MRKRVEHHKLAMTGFIITIAITIIAFYYIWHQTASYGRTIEGLGKIAKIQYCKEEKLSPVQCDQAWINVQLHVTSSQICSCWENVYSQSTNQLKRQTRVLILQDGDQFGSINYKSDERFAGLDTANPVAFCERYCEVVQPKGSTFACYAEECKGMPRDRQPV